MPEVSDAELMTLKRTEALLNKMWNHPKKGLAFKREVKELIPEANIPELDTIDTVARPFEDKIAKQDEEIKKLTERLEAREKAEDERKEENNLTESLSKARKKFGLTDEGFEKAVSRMREMKNLDAEAAAAWVASQEKKAKPVGGSGIGPQAMNLYGSKTQDENYKELNLDPQGWADREIEKMINEFAEAEAA